MFAGLRFPLHVVQHGVDVPHDLFELVGRIAFEDQHDVMGKIGQSPKATQQIAYLVLGVLHLVRESVQSFGQLMAPSRQLVQLAGQF
ncbi:hypothetical protein A5680_18420 [Mycobacterium sp. E2989]|nr:hypothetical protein A5680_18420 [Mycobacterium sp. E2989]